MSSDRECERIVGALAMLIDADEPPGLAARELARTVVSLVRDRESPDAVRISGALIRLGARFPRRKDRCCKL
jgi:hypothetical protein